MNRMHPLKTGAAVRSHAVVELTGLVAFQNLSSKFNSALGVPAHGFCRLPADAPREQAVH